MNVVVDFAIKNWRIVLLSMYDAGKEIEPFCCPAIPGEGAVSKKIGRNK